MSVRGGRRVEIKGVPKAGWAPGLVHGEAWRQVNLLKLRDDIQRRQGVTVTVVNHAAMLDSVAFRGLPGIGLADLETVGSQTPMSAAAHVFQELKPFVDQAKKDNPNREDLIARLDVFQPTRPLVGQDGSVYVARVVEADPSHPARSMDDVREQLVRDVIDPERDLGHADRKGHRKAEPGN